MALDNISYSFDEPNLRTSQLRPFSTQFQRRNASITRANDSQIRIANVNGNRALQFTRQNGERRVELNARNVWDQGETLTFSGRVRFNNNIPSAGYVTQLKESYNGTSEGNLAGSLRVQNGRLLILGLSQSVAVRPNQWIDYTVQVSRDRNNRGQLTGWLNGQQVGTRNNVRFGSRNAAHIVKLGLYGGANTTNSAQVVWHDDISIRTTSLGSPLPQPRRARASSVNETTPSRTTTNTSPQPAISDHLTPQRAIAGDSAFKTASRSRGSSSFYTFLSPNGPSERIRSFRSPDKIEISARGFDLAIGKVGGRLAFGNRAREADDRFIYNRETGDLFYDADGNRTRSRQRLLVNLANRPALRRDNIRIVQVADSQPAALVVPPDSRNTGSRGGNLIDASGPVVGNVRGDALTSRETRSIMSVSRSERGRDIYRFNTPLDAPETILGFGAQDRIEIAARNFGIARGAIGDRFTQGSRAADRNDRFIYNRATGDLFFDRDGSGRHFGQQLIATVENRPSLGGRNIAIV